MNKTLPAWCVVGVSAVCLSGCSMWKAYKDDQPLPPPILREVRTLQVPDDLRQSRPASDPAATVLARTAAASVIVTPAPIAAPVAPVASSAAAAAPLPAPAAAPAPAKGWFIPYFPSAMDTAQPKVWTTEPRYDFPWIAGAVPTRVNEETTFGAGSRMLGRVFAKVSFGDAAPSAPKLLPEAVQQTPKEQKAGEPKKSKLSSLSRWLRTVLTSDDKPAKAAQSEPLRTEMPSVINAGMVSCGGVTCLDSARDMLVADARAKGWEMLLNRRVSLHQSFQFRNADRLVSIELDSDGDKSLAIEYSLMPVQSR